MASTPQPKNAYHSADITNYMISVAETFMSAIRERDFSDETWSARHIAFRSEGGYLHHRNSGFNLREHLESLKLLTAENPEVSPRILDYMCHVNEKVGYADICMNVEVTGFPPGIVRKNFGILEFRRLQDGKWWCMRHVGIRG